MDIGGKRTFQKNSIRSEKKAIVKEKVTETPAVSTTVTADNKP